MDYLLKTSVIILIFYGFYKLILQRETFFQSNRWFLLIGILTAVLVPLIVIPIYVEQPTFFTQNFSAITSTSTIIEQESIDWMIVLKYIYLGGILFFGGKFMFNLISLGNLIAAHPKEKNGNYNLIKTDKNISPFSFFSFIVFNPNQFKNNELEQIIIHEKVHAHQFHSIDILLSQIVSIIFWFNPFAWLYKKEIQQNLEFIADDLAQQESACKKSYQKLLLKTSLPQNQLVLTNNFYNSLIKKRIIMLHKNRSKSTNQWKYALILPLITAFIFTFNTKVVAQNKTVEKEIVFEEDTQILIITKNSKKSDFDNIKKEFSKEDVTVNFKKIKRNSKGEITEIAIDASSSATNSTYSISADKPIKPIIISSNNNGEDIIIKTQGTYHGNDYIYVTNARNMRDSRIHKSKKDNSFVFITDDEDTHRGKDDNHKIIEIDIDEDNDGDNSMIWVSKNGKKHKVHKTTNSTVEIIREGDEVIRLNSKNRENYITKNPLIYLDGKEISKEKMEKIDADTIEEVNVIKGDGAVKKYGKKAKDGVILITTKSNR